MKRKIQTAFLIFPNSIFPDLKINNHDKVFIIEDPFFFKPKDYSISKIKLAYFRASMRYFYDHLQHPNKEYIEYSSVKNYDFLYGYEATFYDTVNRGLNDKLASLVDSNRLPTPLFLMSDSECIAYFRKSNKRFVQQHFFEYVKGKMGVLKGVESKDTENRKALPKNHKFKFSLPRFDKEEGKVYYQEAREYIDTHPVFKKNLGSTEQVHRYPITQQASQAHFLQFLDDKVALFGPYEDAVDKKESILFHSFISVPLNVGLLSPQWVLDTIMGRTDIPINSLEGFVRQLIGWREYQRGIYVSFPDLAQSNHFGHSRKLTWEYWNGEKQIGIPILDNEIQKILILTYQRHFYLLRLGVDF